MYLSLTKMNVFLAIVLSLFSIAVVNCVKCYKCTKCNDPFQKSISNSTVSCSSGQCMKTKAKSGDVKVVKRGCAPVKIDNKCEEQTLLGVALEVCTCDTELCNGGPVFGYITHYPLLLAAVVVTVISLIL